MKMDSSEQCDSKIAVLKLNKKEFVLLYIIEGANEIHCRIIADQWVERNALLQTEP